MVVLDKFIKGSFFLFLAKFAASLGPIYVLAGFVQKYGTAAFGLLSSDLVVLGILIYFIQYSFTLDQTKRLISNIGNAQAILTDGISLRLVIATVGTIIFISYVGLSCNSSILLCFILFVEVLNPRWFLMGLKRYDLVSLHQILYNLLIFSGFVFIETADIWLLYAISFGILPLCLNLGFVVVFKRIYSFNLSLGNCLKDLITGVPYFIIQLSPVAYTYCYILLAEYFGLGIDSGRMYIELRFVTMTLGVYGVLTSVSYTLVREGIYGKVKLWLQFAGVISFVLLLLFSDLFWRILTSGQYGDLPLSHSIMFSLIPLLFGIRSIYGINGLIMNDKVERYLTISVGVAVIVLSISLIGAFEYLIYPLFIGHLLYALFSMFFYKIDNEG